MPRQHHEDGRAGDETAPVLVWFRNDLRLDDHPALQAAVATGRPVVCLFVLEDDSDGLRPLGSASRWWLAQSLTSLEAGLGRLDCRLWVFTGSAHAVLTGLAETLAPAAVFWNRRYLAAETAIDSRIKADLAASGIEVRSFAATLLHEPWTILQKNGNPYKVFTPFWRAAEAKGPPRDPVAPPAALVPLPGKATSAIEAVKISPREIGDLDLLPRRPNWAAGWDELWQPGEAGAMRALEDFLAGPLAGYAQDRDRPDRAGTSALSPHLRFGEISPGRVAKAALAAVTPETRTSVTKFLQELTWRDFCYNLLFHMPDLPAEPFNPRFAHFPYRRPDAATLRAWQRGNTGYPIVDAGMRQLWQTGYMHNRVRMVVASFLTKHLLIDWRQGEAWFWDTLVDADPANNVINWQWVAGCGPDAAPYFRVFNPILQGEKFDSDGAYVARLVPELTNLPPRWRHKPWEAGAEVLSKAGVTLGETYPKPIVDHDAARDRALAAFETVKTSA